MRPAPASQGNLHALSQPHNMPAGAVATVDQAGDTELSLSGILPEELDCVTMGMFIIDEIHYPAPRPPLYNILGGGGLYALIGSRLFLPSPHLSRNTSMLIDLGSDFPPHMLTTLKSLNTSSIFRPTPHRLTTRGWNKYGSETDPDFRAFKYLTPKMRVEVKDFWGEGDACWVGERMGALHMICSPKRAERSVRELWTLIDQNDGRIRTKPRPLVLWEPIPDLCTPEMREEMLNTISLIDVVSPNDGELAGFFTDELAEEEQHTLTHAGIKLRTERLAKKLALRRRMCGDLDEGCGAVLVRCGALGCYIVIQDEPNPSPNPAIERRKEKGGEGETIPIIALWLPAYHDLTSEKVVDPTGAGNAFMGGLAIGLRRPLIPVKTGTLKWCENWPRVRKWVVAAAHASVAASFAIEQIGLPVVTGGEGNEERWNGELVGERMEVYLERLGRKELEVERVDERGREEMIRFEGGDDKV
ncbi:structural stability of L-A double stranded RNA-containing protein [Tirmania nivea]|nr:structural stability of L-A double stranded RNA-containing protein [Tirmania nivea]